MDNEEVMQLLTAALSIEVDLTCPYDMLNVTCLEVKLLLGGEVIAVDSVELPEAISDD